MASRLDRTVLRLTSYILSDRLGIFFAKKWSTRLLEELCDKVTDTFLELLLSGMDLAFCLSKGYRKNIMNFEGRYLFRTSDDRIVVAATFKGGDMKVHGSTIDDWDTRITFKDGPALRAFIFSRDHDILNSILANDVEIDGNFNYLYKFGFMARDLARRLGVT